MFYSPKSVRRSVQRQFNRAKILVVGDLMLDAYLWGDVHRISPEAPVPVVRLVRRTETAGGAGNVALNLASLGLNVTVAGFVGDDEPGRHLVNLLEASGVECLAIKNSDSRPTATKTRVIGGHQQMLRIDEECSITPPDRDGERLIKAVLPLLTTETNAIILSDYGKGVLTQWACHRLIHESRILGVPVLVDPKGKNFSKYARATAITPNRHELELVSAIGDAGEPDLNSAAIRMRSELELEFLVLTLGEHGIRLFDEHGSLEIPANARQVFDVCGAGDTLIATLAAGISSGICRDDSLRLANLAAGIVVGKVGTSPICPDELLAAIDSE